MGGCGVTLSGVRQLHPGLLRRAVVSTGGLVLTPDVHPGDQVALHWDWIRDVPRPPAVRALRHYTECQLRLVNETLDRPAADLVLRWPPGRRRPRHRAPPSPPRPVGASSAGSPG